MKIKINEENYVVGYATAGNIEGVEYNKDLNEHFYENSRYYYLENDTLVFDETKYNEDIAKQEEARKESELRSSRKRELEAFDVYKSNIFYGIVEETEERKIIIMEWYTKALDLDEEAIANPPVEISKYM